MANPPKSPLGGWFTQPVGPPAPAPTSGQAPPSVASTLPAVPVARYDAPTLDERMEAISEYEMTRIRTRDGQHPMSELPPVREMRQAIEDKPRTTEGTTSFLGTIFGVGTTVEHPDYQSFTDVQTVGERTDTDLRRLGQLRTQGAGVLDALKPQVIASPAADAIEAYWNPSGFLRKQVQEAVEKSRDIVLDADREAVIQGLASITDPKVRDLLARAYSKPMSGKEEAALLQETDRTLTDVGMDSLRYMLTEMGPDGRIVESDTATVLRGLGTLVGVAAGAVEHVVEGALSSDRDLFSYDQFVGSIDRAVRDGEGFVDVLGRWGNYAGDGIERLLNLPDADWNLELAGQVAGGLAGFGIDIVIPLDAFIGKGLGTVTKGARRAALTGAVDAAINAPELTRGLRARAATGDVIEGAPRPTFKPTLKPEEGVSPLAQAEDKFVQANRQASTDFLRASAHQHALAPDEVAKVIDEAVQSEQGIDLARPLTRMLIEDAKRATVEPDVAALTQKSLELHTAMHKAGWFDGVDTAKRNQTADRLFGRKYNDLTIGEVRYIREYLATEGWLQRAGETIDNAAIRVGDDLGRSVLSIADILDPSAKRFTSTYREPGMIEMGAVPDSGTSLIDQMNSRAYGPKVWDAIADELSRQVARKNYRNALRAPRSAVVSFEGDVATEVGKLAIDQTKLADLSVRVPDTDVRVPREAAPKVAKAIAESPVGQVSARLREGKVTVTKQEREAILDYLAPGIRHVPFEQLEDAFPARGVETLTWSGDTVADLMRVAGSIEGRKVPGWSSLSDEGVTIQSLRSRSAVFKGEGLWVEVRRVASAFRDKVRATRLENAIFESPDRRRGYLSAAIRTAMDEGRWFRSIDYAADPVWGRVTSDIRNRMASIGLDFERAYAKNLKVHPNPKHAWLATVVDRFDTPEKFVEDYVVALYGGLERIDTAIRGASMDAALENGPKAINRFLRQAVFPHSPFLEEAGRKFSVAMQDGRIDEAIRTLTGLHATLIARPVDDVLSQMGRDTLLGIGEGLGIKPRDVGILRNLNPSFGINETARFPQLPKMFSAQVDGTYVPTSRLITAVYAQRYYVDEILDVVRREGIIYPQRYFDTGAIKADLADAVRRTRDVYRLGTRNVAKGEQVDLFSVSNRYPRDVWDRLVRWHDAGTHEEALSRIMLDMTLTRTMDRMGRGFDELFEQYWKVVEGELTSAMRGIDPVKKADALASLKTAMRGEVQDQAIQLGRQFDRTLSVGSATLTAVDKAEAEQGLRFAVFPAEYQSPADAIRSLPTVRYNADLRQSLLASLSLEDSTKTIDSVRGVGKVEPIEGLNFDSPRLVEELDLRAQEFMALTDRFQPTPSAMHVAEYANNARALARGGALGGAFLPHPAFLMMNLASAPFIMLQQLGVGRTSRILKKSALGSVPSWKFHRFAMGMGDARPTDVLLTTPNGTKYTYEQVADLVSKASLTRSQARAESIGSLAQEFHRLQTSVAWQRGNPFGYNLWNRVANEVDNGFRIRTFLDALEEGEPVDRAAQLARDAVLDYGRLTGFERETINRVFWFWTFQSRFASSTIRALMDNPQRLYVASRFNTTDLSGLLSELGVPGVKYEDDTYSAEYMRGRAYRVLIEDPTVQERYALYGPDLPLSSTVTSLIDLMAGFHLLSQVVSGAEDKTRLDAAGDVRKGIVNTTFERGMPALKFIAANLGYDPETYNNEPPTYLDPRLVATIQQVGLWEAFTSVVAVEPDDRPGKQGTTFEGSIWKVRESSKATWDMLQVVMLSAGIQRTLRTYGPLMDEAILDGIKGTPRDKRDPKMRTLPAIGALLGVATPVNELTEQERRNLNEKSVVNELRDRAKR